MALNSKKVLVGLSGGVDSSVTALLLREMGFDVVGVHMKFWVDPGIPSADSKSGRQNKCCTIESLMKVREMTDRFNIPFYVFDFSEKFKERVVDPFIGGYSSGLTPNPCVECNRNIKFGLFLDKMRELGADYVATGHYARIIKGENGLELHSALDQDKDQSYFLYTLTQQKLRHILFPLGDYSKTEVRSMAEKFGISEFNKQQESQNLCFFPEDEYGSFLHRHLPSDQFISGDIVSVDGRKLGVHHGLPYYTIGQRKGLLVGGTKGESEPWYVVKIDIENNRLIVGHHQDLYCREFDCNELSWTDAVPANGEISVQVKIRYRAIAQPATLKLGNNVATVIFDEPQRAVTPGQSAVFYNGTHVLGGGLITSVKM